MTTTFRKNFDYEDEHNESNPNRAITYTASNDEKDAVKGELTVMHTGAHGYTVYPAHPDYTAAGGGAVGRDPKVMNGVRGDAATGDYRMGAYSGDWARRQANINPHSGELLGQIPLFDHRSRQARDTVHYMRTSKDSRALAGPLLGLAARDSMRNGRMLTPSDDLSSHSAPLVQRINNTLGTQFAAERSNDLDFQQYEVPAPRGGQPVPPHELEEGRQFARRQLRSPRAQPKFEQSMMFGN